MRPEDEFENFVGYREDEYEEHEWDLCRRCNDWPCRCIREQRLDEVEDAGF